MKIQGKRTFFFAVILVVSLLFYFLGRKQADEQEYKISSQKIQSEEGILVKRVMMERDENETMKVALTFDDGPHPYYTEQLLDGLKERGVCATFFVTGEHAQLHPDIIERMNKEGD